MNFGLYESIPKEKSEFFIVLRHLLLIFEFEQNYPEGQILLDKTRSLKENKGFKKKIFSDVLGALGQTGKMLNVFQMFGGLNTGLNKKKKKREEEYFNKIMFIFTYLIEFKLFLMKLSTMIQISNKMIF